MGIGFDWNLIKTNVKMENLGKEVEKQLMTFREVKTIAQE
nr:MAG TPA: hypothetical protein [Caudoviricetes sp.]